MNRLEEAIMNPPRLVVLARPGSVTRFVNILQLGMMVPHAGTRPLAEFLLAIPGLDHDYVLNRVQTIFVNGMAQDDPNVPIRVNDVVALSAAMPGLAGAIFRRGGIHAALRSVREIRQIDGVEDCGNVRVKLFNMIAREKGAALLRQGICLSGRDCAAYLARPEFAGHILALDLADERLSLSELLKRLPLLPFLLLRVVTKTASG